MADNLAESNHRVYPAVKVLMYHRVESDGPCSDSYPWTVTVSQLRRHLQLITRWGYTPICFEDILTYNDGMLRLPKRPVILTFDDGCSRTADNVMSVFSDFGARGTFFVLGNRLITSSEWDSGRGYRVVTLLNHRQVRELHTAGFEVGSHTMSHPNLTSIPPTEIEREVIDSKKALEDLLQEEIVTFAYPFGAVNHHAKRIVEDAGYDFGCGVYSGPPKFGMDPFNVRRVPVTRNTTVFDLALKMLTPYEYYAWMRWKVTRSLPFYPDD